MSIQWVKCKVVGDGTNEPFRPSIARVNEEHEKAHGAQKYPVSYGIAYEPANKFCLVRIEADEAVKFDPLDVEGELSSKEHWARLYQDHPHLRARWGLQPDETGENVPIEEWHERIELDPADTLPFVPNEEQVDPTYFFSNTNTLVTTQTTSAVSMNTGNVTEATEQTVNWACNVYINFGSGSTQIGTNIAPVSRSGVNASGFLTNTWAAPYTLMNTTDNVVVNVQENIAATVKGQNFPTAASPAASSLSASTWTVNYWTKINYNSSRSNQSANFTYGISTQNSQINNLNFGFAVLESESATLADSFQMGSSSLRVESISLMDRFAEFDVSLQSLFNETATLSDSSARFDVSLSVTSETVSLTDSLSSGAGQALSQSASESLTLSDVFAEFDVSLNLPSEAVTLLDSTGPFQSGPDMQESLSLTDVFILPGGTALTQSATETLTVTDVFAEFDVSLNLMQESVSLADVFQFSAQPSGLAETVTLQDNFGPFQASSLMSETLSTSSIFQLPFTQSVSETITLSDAFGPQQAGSLMQETLSLSDSGPTPPPTISMFETLTLADYGVLSQPAVQHSVSLTETLALSDSNLMYYPPSNAQSLGMYEEIEMLGNSWSQMYSVGEYKELTG